MMANDNLSHDPGQPRASRRGFAGMDAEKRRLIARKGGQAVSRNRQHMSEIGRRGGVASGGAGKQAELSATDLSGTNLSGAATPGGNTQLQ
jgi:general stress protein YciG